MAKSKGKARARDNKKKRLQRKNEFFLRRKKLMSLIRKWDDPILKIPCENVDDSEDISPIVRELKQILKLSDSGVGLSASQIGHLKKVVVLCPNRKTNDMKVLVNPEIIEMGEEKQMGREGCLSFPNFYVGVERSKEVVVAYVDEEGKSQKDKFVGFESIIVQHEIDHVNGLCLVGSAWRKTQGEDEETETSGAYEVVESEDFKRERDVQEQE